MIRWGAILLFLGVGSFILPLLGMQFGLINIFGDDPMTTAIVFVVVGAILVAIGRAREGRPRAGAAPQVATTVPQTPQASQPRPSVPSSPQPQAATSGAGFCGNCGAALRAGAKFCTSCGQAV